MQLGVVLLGAGASSRMGRPKLLLPWGSKSILRHLVAQWREVGSAQLAVVSATGDQALAHELDRLGTAAPDRIINPAPQEGMFSSIRCAATWHRWRPDLTHWAIALGDQPQLAIQTLRELVRFAGDHPEDVCQPAYLGRPRHPVVLPKGAFLKLAQTRASTLKEFLHAQPVALWASNDEGLAIDLDTPDDYAAAVARFVRPPQDGECTKSAPDGLGS